MNLARKVFHIAVLSLQAPAGGSQTCAQGYDALGSQLAVVTMGQNTGRLEPSSGALAVLVYSQMFEVKAAASIEPMEMGVVSEEVACPRTVALRSCAFRTSFSTHSQLYWAHSQESDWAACCDLDALANEMVMLRADTLERKNGFEL